MNWKDAERAIARCLLEAQRHFRTTGTFDEVCWRDAIDLTESARDAVRLDAERLSYQGQPISVPTGLGQPDPALADELRRRAVAFNRLREFLSATQTDEQRDELLRDLLLNDSTDFLEHSLLRP